MAAHVDTESRKFKFQKMSQSIGRSLRAVTNASRLRKPTYWYQDEADKGTEITEVDKDLEGLDEDEKRRIRRQRRKEKEKRRRKERDEARRNNRTFTVASQLEDTIADRFTNVRDATENSWSNAKKSKIYTLRLIFALIFMAVGVICTLQFGTDADPLNLNGGGAGDGGGDGTGTGGGGGGGGIGGGDGEIDYEVRPSKKRKGWSEATAAYRLPLKLTTFHLSLHSLSCSSFRLSPRSSLHSSQLEAILSTLPCPMDRVWIRTVLQEDFVFLTPDLTLSNVRSSFDELFGIPVLSIDSGTILSRHSKTEIELQPAKFTPVLDSSLCGLRSYVMGGPLIENVDFNRLDLAPFPVKIENGIGALKYWTSKKESAAMLKSKSNSAASMVSALYPFVIESYEIKGKATLPALEESRSGRVGLPTSSLYTITRGTYQNSDITASIAFDGALTFTIPDVGASFFEIYQLTCYR